MSKIVTTRYEYVVYDDAAPGSSLTALPPTYPPTLDQYSSTTIASAAAGYGVSNINSTGASQQISVPSTAGGIVVCPVSNTTMVSITFTAVIAPGGSSVTTALLCGPGQSVVIPAAWVFSVATFAASSPAGTSTLNTPFAAQLLWSF